MIRDNFTGNADDRQTSRSGIRSERRGREQNRSLRTHNLLTAALFLTLLIVGCSLLIVTADEADAGSILDGNIRYEIDDTTGTATVCGSEGIGGTVDIPSTVTNGGKTYTVIAIGESVFKGDTFTGSTVPTSVTIPNTVTSIGNYAFQYCTSLTSITIPNSVTTIGEYAFQKCSFTSITIPNTVTSIGECAFYNCTGLTSVTIPGSVNGIENSAFYGCTGLTTLTISEGVQTIIATAFGECAALTSVFIPKSITSLSEDAFADDKGQNGITFKDADGSTVLSVGVDLKGYTYTGSNKVLTRIDPAVQTIGDFTYRLSLDSTEKTATVIGYTGTGGNVEIPGTVTYSGTEYTVIAIGNAAFSNKTGLTTVTVPSSVTEIGDYAFSGCTGLTTVTFEEGSAITKIGSNAFYGCTALGSITIPGTADTEITIGKNAFANSEVTHSLKSVTIGGKVRSIGETAFYQCYSLETVTFSNGVSTEFRSIESSTFYCCLKLKSFTIPDSVTSIGTSAFSTCTSLTSMSIPDSVTSIGNSAFTYCTGLTSVTFGDGITTLGSDVFYGYSIKYATNGGAKFYADDECTIELTAASDLKGKTFTGADCKLVNNDPTLLYKDGIKYRLSEASPYTAAVTGYYTSGMPSNGAVTIPPTVEKNSNTYNVTAIGKEAFKGCTVLLSLTIDNSVTGIGENAFSGCTGLTSVTFGNGLTAYADWGVKFFKADGTTQIDGSNFSELKGNTFKGTYTDGLTKTGYIIFTYSDGTTKTVSGIATTGTYTRNTDIKKVEIGDGVTSITDHAFEECTNLTEVSLPDSLRSIGLSAFKGCSKLETVTFGNGVTTIGEYAFYECESLKSGIKLDSVTNIGNSAFYECKLLESEIKLNSIESIGSSAFFDCSKITVLTVGNGLTNIEHGAFSGCSGITSVTIPNSVRIIPTSVFFNCSKLKTVTFEEGSKVESIKMSAFSGCSSLESISIPETVTSIEKYVFSGCTSLTSANIPGSVTVIGDGTFYDCSKLTEIIIPDKVTEIGWNAFEKCTGLTSVTIPNLVTEIQDNAFLGCKNLETVVIGNSVKTIGNKVFGDCVKLKSINIPFSVTSIADGVFNGTDASDNVTFYESADSMASGTSLTVSVENLSGNTFAGNGDKKLVKVPLTIGDITYSQSGGKDLTAIGYAGSETADVTLTIPSTVSKDGKDYNVIAVGNNGFKGETKLKTVTIGNGIKSIGTNAFSGCTNLASVTVPDSVTDIGKGAFGNCTGITKAYFGKGIENIGDGAFTGITFYDTGGTQTLTANVDNLKGNLFETADGKLTKADLTIITVDGITYKLSTEGSVNTATVSGYSGTDMSLTIPQTVTDDRTGSEVTYDVTGIGANAFKGCTSLTTISIPDSVTSIGAEAFNGCVKLTSVTIPESVTIIDNATFYECGELTSVTILGPVTKIALNAFNSCSKLTSITIPDTVKEIENYAFNKCTSLTTVNIPNSVTRIGDGAFTYCTGLTSATIGNGVTIIDDWAFEGCTVLKTVTMGNSVETIDSSAFKGCASLESITVPDTVTSIGTSAFQNCTGLKSVTVPGSVVTIKAQTFDGCTALETAVIGNGITTIGSKAFDGCTGLKTVVMSDTIASNGIGSDVFDSTIKFKDADGVIDAANYSDKLKGGTFLNDTDALKKVDSVSVGDFTYTFSGTDATVTGYNGSATDVTIPSEVKNNGITYSVTKIGNNAFEENRTLTAITIPNSVTSIGDSAFYKCKLTEITIPDSVTSIGQSAFNTTKIKSVTIPNGVEKIKSSTFRGCTNLASVIISDSVTDIESDAFDSCTGLTTVIFGNGITTVAWDAFDVTFKDTNGSTLDIKVASNLKGKTFKGTDRILTEYVPTVTEDGVVYTLSLADKTAAVSGYEGSPTDVTIRSKVTDSTTGIECTVTTVKEDAFKDCASLTSIVIPDSVETIKYHAFKGCVGLKSVTLGTGITKSGLDHNAFEGCSGISLTILCEIEDSMFSSRTYFSEVTVGNEVTGIGKSAFNGCTLLSTITIGDKVTGIGEMAFFECAALESVTIPDLVTSIGEYAFWKCTGLISVTIGNGATGISAAFYDIPFYDSDGTTELTADDDLKNNTFVKTGDKLVKSDALILTDENGIKYRLSDADHTATVIGYTGSGTDVTIPSTVSKDGVTYTVKTIGKDAFKGKTLTSVTIGNNVTDIGESAFENCTGLTTLSIANGVTTIGESAFSGCTGLESITIGSEATGILAAFSGFTFYDSDGESLLTTDEALRNSTFIKTEGKLVKTDAMILIVDEIKYRLSPDGTATVIGYTGSGTDVTIPSTVSKDGVTYTVKTIGKDAFKGKTLTSVTIGNNVTDIGESAFENCTGLTSVSFGSSVRTIKTNAFSGCTGLITVTIPESVETIGNNAFTGCTGLTTLSIANGITTIGESAFGGCTGIMSVEIPNSVTDIKASAFNGCTSLTRAQIGNHTATIGEKAFYGCPLTYLCIPASVTFIGASAFNLVTFHDADGTPITDLDAEHLKDSTFEGTSSSEMRKTGSAPAYTDSNEFQFPFIIFCVIITLLALAIMFSKKRL